MSFRIITLIMIMAVMIPAAFLFLGIAILLLIHLCIVSRAVRRTLNSRRPAETGVSSFLSGNGGGMSQEEVQKLPSFEYKHGGKYIVLDRMLSKDDDNNDDDNNDDGDDDNNDDGDYSGRNMNYRTENGLRVDEFDCSVCSICLDGFQSGEICRLLPVCRHTFHANCVASWLYKNPLCPICRTTARQHGGERVTVVLENVLELAQVESCEIGSGTRDIVIDIAMQRGEGAGWGPGFHQTEMSNLVPNPPPIPISIPTDEFVCNLMSTASLPYRPNDDHGGGGVSDTDVLSLSHNQSHNSQNQNQNSCKLISIPIPSCRTGDDDGMPVGVSSLSQSQSEIQNSCNSMSIPVPSFRPPDEDGAMVNGISIANQRQYQNRTVCDSTLPLLLHCRPADNEGVRVIGVTCLEESQIQCQTRDGDAMA